MGRCRTRSPSLYGYIKTLTKNRNSCPGGAAVGDGGRGLKAVDGETIFGLLGLLLKSR
jgi:hypothetical protein